MVVKIRYILVLLTDIYYVDANTFVSLPKKEV